MTTEKYPLSSQQADEIIHSNFQSQADLAIDTFRGFNKWIQCNSDAWCLMMEQYDVEFNKFNGKYISIKFLPK
jgi:hypothetical protein